MLSCVSKRNYYYLNKSGYKAPQDSIFSNIKTSAAFEHVLDHNDQVLISLEPNQYQLGSGQRLGSASNVKVGLDGNISIPFVGKVKVDGMTISQLSDTIYSLYSKVYINPSVNVQLVSFNISVLGDVRTPGLKIVGVSTINIFEAIGMGGDLSEEANRKTVKVLRKNKADKTDMYELDLTSVATLSSEAFYLKSNDIIIVQQYNYKRYLNKAQQFYGVLSAINIILTISFRFL
ncbi:MAG: polysaccharide biosynthesis/export family protein [Bacteroidota bacterium]|nr:polysaccharide biosynthesis/export family protein [Bacteroidota bacterium]